MSITTKVGPVFNFTTASSNAKQFVKIKWLFCSPLNLTAAGSQGLSTWSSGLDGYKPFLQHVHR